MFIVLRVHIFQRLVSGQRSMFVENLEEVFRRRLHRLSPVQCRRKTRVRNFFPRNLVVFLMDLQLSDLLGLLPDRQRDWYIATVCKTDSVVQSRGLTLTSEDGHVLRGRSGSTAARIIAALRHRKLFSITPRPGCCRAEVAVVKTAGRPEESR